MLVCNAMDSSTCDAAPSTPCVGLPTTRVGEPDAGNLHVRFDERERRIAAPYSTGLTLVFFVRPRFSVLKSHVQSCSP